MKTAQKIIIASLLAIAPIASLTQASAATSAAPEAVVIKINSDGFRTCNIKKSNGNSYYRAKVRGYLLDGAAGGSYRGDGNNRFSVTTCFDTAQSCNHWVKRITHTIPGVSEIKYANCKIKS